MKRSSILILAVAMTMVATTSHAANQSTNQNATCYVMYSFEVDAEGFNPLVTKGCADNTHSFEQSVQVGLNQFVNDYTKKRGFSLRADELVGTRTLGYAGYNPNGGDGHRLYVSYVNNDPGDCDSKGYRIRLERNAAKEVESFIGAVESPACNRATYWQNLGNGKRDSGLPINHLEQDFSHNVGQVVYYHK